MIKNYVVNTVMVEDPNGRVGIQDLISAFYGIRVPKNGEINLHTMNVLNPKFEDIDAMHRFCREKGVGFSFDLRYTLNEDQRKVFEKWLEDTGYAPRT